MQVLVAQAYGGIGRFVQGSFSFSVVDRWTIINNPDTLKHLFSVIGLLQREWRWISSWNEVGLG